MSAVATIPLQVRKQQLVREAIWDAAVDLFAQQGFDETTVDDIAVRAGVSRRSFFRYFASKNDLMAQGVQSYGEELTGAIDGCAPDASLPEVFRQTVIRVASRCTAHPRAFKVMEIAAKYPSARAAQLSRMSEVQDQVAEAYARRGPEDRLAAGILAGLTLSVLAVTFRTWFDQGQPDITALAERIFETLGRVI